MLYDFARFEVPISFQDSKLDEQLASGDVGASSYLPEEEETRKE